MSMGAEHYREAEQLLAQARIPARERAVPNWLTVEEIVAAAQVHATLALTAATAVQAIAIAAPSIGDPWREAIR